MLRCILLPFVLLLTSAVFSQSSVDMLKRSADAGQRMFDQRVARTTSDTIVYAPEDCEVQPEPVGGMETFYASIGKAPCSMLGVVDECIASRVQVSMVIGPDGFLSDLSAESRCPELEDLAICSVRNSGPWKPGEKDGRPVRVRMTVPIQVCLR